MTPRGLRGLSFQRCIVDDFGEFAHGTWPPDQVPWQCSYPPLVSGAATVVDYPDGERAQLRDVVMIDSGACGGHVGVVDMITADWVTPARAYATLLRVHPDGNWPREHVLGALKKVVPTVPKFTDAEQVDRWCWNARDLECGQDVRFTITGGWGEKLTYEGKLAEIDHNDITYWMENRPRAMGKFKVCHLVGDHPVLTTTYWLERL